MGLPDEGLGGSSDLGGRALLARCHGRRHGQASLLDVLMGACSVCWSQEENRVMIYKGETWCSDDCRKVVQGETPPTQKQLMMMPDWLLDQLGIPYTHNSILSRGGS